jgi:hypothetical protein
MSSVTELFAAAAFNQIRRGGHGRATKSDEGDPLVECLLAGLDRLEYVVEVFGRRGEPELANVGCAAHRIRHHRRGIEVHLHPHRVEHDQDIREQDRGIEVESVDRLPGDLGAEVGRFTQFLKRHLGPDLPILGEIAPGLTHDPDWGSSWSRSATSLQERLVSQRHRPDYTPRAAVAGTFAWASQPLPC